MKLYADRPLRLANQVLGDLLVLIVVWFAVRLGRGTHGRVAELAGPGRAAEDSARNIGGKLRGAAESVADTPLVGGTLAQPFRDLAATSRSLADTAQSYQDAVEQVATLAGVLVAAVPILLILIVWLPRRVGWVVEATAASRLMSSHASADLLAVRALARQPLRRLSRLSPEVVTGWKAGDPAATRELAALELDELGLRHAEAPATSVTG